VHRRCRDDKAAVRKSALSLLEHIVVMRCSWNCMQPLAPSQQDLGALEAATADSLVRGARRRARRGVAPAGLRLRLPPWCCRASPGCALSTAR
jgi:hypothetical protein